MVVLAFTKQNNTQLELSSAGDERQRLRSSFTVKLIISFIVIAVIPLYALMMLSRWQSASNFRDEYTLIMSAMTGKQADSLSDLLEGMEKEANRLASDEEHINMLKGTENNIDEAIINSARLALKEKAGCSEVVFYLNTESLSEGVKSVSELNSLAEQSSPRVSYWKLSEGKRAEYISVITFNNKKYGYSFVSDESQIFSLLSSNNAGQGNYYLIDKNGNILTSSEHSALQTVLKDDFVFDMIRSGQHNSYKNNSIYIKNQIGTFDLYLIRIIDDDRITSRTDSFNRIIQYISYFFFLLILITSVIYSKGLLSRVLSLESAIRSNRLYSPSGKKKNKYDDKNYVPGDEIDRLILNYNKMHTQVETLISDVYLAETEKSKSHLATLQAQINPHFLYNVLDSVKSCLDSKKYEDTRKIVITLANFYRKCLSGGQESIPIRRELEIITAYIELEKLCYGDFFDIEYKFDESMLDFYIIKFSLQPILENAINHGLRSVDRRGEILITGEYGSDYIDITIHDNGPGIQSEKLIAVIQGLSEEFTVNEKGYGLRNVNARMKLHYGQQYGIVDIKSINGTSVKIRIPQDV